MAGQSKIASPAPDGALVLPGVVIEEIPKGSELAKAGLQVGDVIMSWERLANPAASSPEGAEGALASSFDWLKLEVEHVPRGAVVLRGRRGGEHLELRVEPGLWDGKVRPVLSPVLTESYSTGTARFTSGDVEAAIEAWGAIADLGKGDCGGDLRAWIELRIGDAWGERVEWRKAEEAYRQAVVGAERPMTQIAAWRSLGEAFESLADYVAAREAYVSSAEIAQKLDPDGLIVAFALHNLGTLERDQGSLKEAETHLLRVLEIRERLAPQSLEVADSLNDLGGVAWFRGDLHLADVYYLRALTIHQRLAPESLNAAATLNNAGLLSWSRGDLAGARNYYLQALRIEEQLAPKSLDLATTLNNLGSVAQDQGDFDRAQDLLLQALHIREGLSPKSLDMASSFNNLGLLAGVRGELDHATDYVLRALQILSEIAPESFAMAITLNNMGALAQRRGELERAHAFMLRGLRIQEHVAPESLDLANTLSNLGTLAQDRGDLESANDDQRRAYRLRKRLAPHSLDLAVSLHNLGSLAQARGELGRADNYHRRALRIREQLAPHSLDVASSLNNLGDIAQDRKMLAKAQDYRLRALEIQEELAPRDIATAVSLNLLGDAARDHGDLNLASQRYARAMEVLEQQVAKLGGSYQAQAGFRAEYEDFFHDMLALLLTQDHFTQAFQVLERFRAQTFLAMLAERDTAFTADIPDDLDRERRRLGGQYDRTLKKLAGLNPRDNGEEIEATRRELQNLDSEAGDIEARIRQASPRLAALKYPHSFDPAEAQQALDPGTLLLSYSVGKEKTSLFALSRSGELEVKVLPLGEAALRSQVAQLLSLIREAAQGSSLGALRQQRLQTSSRELYTALLGPVEERIAASERLLILPDGPLHVLPFAALVRDIDAEPGRAQYLAEWKPIHVALSATVFAELKQRRRPASESQAPFQLAAFGDPVYPRSLTEPKGASSAALPTPAGVIAQTDLPGGDPIVRSAADRGVFDWQSLPYTRHEVEGIARLFPAGTARIFLGSEALEERIKSLDPKTRILHLAAHGYTDEHLPSSSFVALTIPEDTNPDAAGPERDNGLLQVWEIFEKVRLDADLVVLSACDTGLGEEQGGEGLIGLTRAFQYAGARTVMASLWSVQDRATSELMIRFYKHLRNGLPKDEALRQAQIELIRGPIEAVDEKGEKTVLDATAPYYWAGFQVYGDWQ
jgi:CHAT domain-containing protein/tetratricopeptide (TPR) repeat protein